MVKQHLYFIDYTATEGDEIITDSDLIMASTPFIALQKLYDLLLPETILSIEYIGEIKNGDCEDI